MNAPIDGPDSFESPRQSRSLSSNSDVYRQTITRVKNGLYIPEQVPRAALRSCQDSQVQSVEAILGRIHRAIPKDQGREYADKARVAERRAGRFAINRIIRPLEDEALQKWAKESDLLLKNADFQAPWEAAGMLGESEHDVYPDPQSGLWFKRNNLSQHGTWLEYFQRLILHDWLFPDTELTFRGFVEHEDQLLPICTQQDIPSIRGANETEIDAFMAEMGFAPIRPQNPSRQYDYFSADLGIEVNDLHDENVLVRPNGDLAIMDPVPMMEETSKIKRICELEE